MLFTKIYGIINYKVEERLMLGMLGRVTFFNVMDKLREVQQEVFDMEYEMVEFLGKMGDSIAVINIDVIE